MESKPAGSSSNTEIVQLSYEFFDDDGGTHDREPLLQAPTLHGASNEYMGRPQFGLEMTVYGFSSNKQPTRAKEVFFHQFIAQSLVVVESDEYGGRKVVGL
ncbi:Hypothetical predicted protein [Olea europaea subsp. europaea]|uniref:Uncharacterized protein n=1 Tax=Olea europaea subsp. europaea TaxID=158383 RepID=A0A8S0U7J9_OLEEU|nr:Hypothetical predicted protein [Olea europaea subsp. europaea]